MEELKELEKDSRELLLAIKSKADTENMEMPLPQLDIKDDEPKLLRRRIPSWVAVAAMFVGITIGFIIPEHQTEKSNKNSVFNYADTCRSIAQDDVNLSLLVTSLKF